MNKVFLIISALFFTTFSYSQQVSRYVIATGGNYSNAGGINISSTIGESIVATTVEDML